LRGLGGVEDLAGLVPPCTPTIGARLVEDDHDVFLQYGVERNSYPYDYTVVPYIDGTGRPAGWRTSTTTTW
jgi:hypothetical protein